MIIKQVNALKPFDMYSRKAIPKKHFVLEENNCEEEINLTPRDRICNINWWKCGYKCNPMATFAESVCLLLSLKSRTTRVASRHLAFMGNCPTSSRKH